MRRGKIHHFHFSFSCLSGPNIKVSYSFSSQFSMKILVSYSLINYKSKDHTKRVFGFSYG